MSDATSKGHMPPKCGKAGKFPARTDKNSRFPVHKFLPAVRV